MDYVEQKECMERMEHNNDGIYARLWWLIGSMIVIGIGLAGSVVASHVTTRERIAKVEIRADNNREMLTEIRQDVKKLLQHNERP